MKLNLYSVKGCIPLKYLLTSSARQFYTLLFVIAFSCAAFGQTLVTYNFTNNLTPTAPNPAISPLSLGYYDPPVVGSPQYFADALQYRNSADEIRFAFNGSSFNGLNFSFTAWAGALGFGGISARFDVFMKIGLNPEFSLGQINVTANYLGWSEQTFAMAIPAADNQSDVQIRIVGNKTNDFGFAFKGYGIDNLVLSSNVPKIQASGYNTTNVLTQIAHEAIPATSYGTDFGILNTEDVELPSMATRTFRITNPGTAPLIITGITFSGGQADDFAHMASPATPTPSTPAAVNPINTFPATIAIGASRDFTVRFNPSADGKRITTLNIASNAEQNPYSFDVEGRGSTCATTEIMLKANSMEASQPASLLLPTNVVAGNMNFISGTSQPSAHTPLTDTRLFPNSTSTANTAANTYNLYATGSNTRSWYINNETSTVAFGPLDVSTENGVYISFSLAAFSTATGTTFNNSDYVEVEILKPDTDGSNPADWSKELQIRGNNSGSGSNTRYSYTVAGGLTADIFYDGDNLSIIRTNGNNANQKYNNVKIKIPGSANFQNLFFRITAYNGSAEKLWLIDDVKVSSAIVIERRWSGTGWVDGNNTAVAAPDEVTNTYKNFKTVFEGDYSVPTELTICDCEVQNTAHVTIPANSLLKVQTKVTNLGTENNLIVQDGGNLIQMENDAINSGNIQVEKVFNFSSGRQQYNYVISPTVGTNIKSLYTGVIDNNISALYYNQATNYFGVSNGAYIPGRSLAVKEPSTGTNGGHASTPAKFIGVPANGVINYALAYSNNAGGATKSGYNLVGNPYPSNLDLIALYNANNARIMPTFQFWDNRGNLATTQQGNTYGGESYAKFNALNETGVNATAPASAASPPRTPTRYVSPVQGFIVQARSTANGQNLVFSNTNMRVSNAATQFFGKTAQKTESNRYWLSFITPTDLEYSSAVVYFEGGSNAFGTDDSHASESSDNIYTMADENKISIHGRPIFNGEDVVPLGYTAFAAGSYKIALQNKEGVFNNGQGIYLKDKALNVVTNLTEGAYQFDTQAGDFTGRFEIVYQQETTLLTSNVVKEGLQVFRNGQDFVVRAKSSTIDFIELYDISGRLQQKIKGNQKEVTIPAAYLNNGVYVLKISLNGEWQTRKILK